MKHVERALAGIFAVSMLLVLIISAVEYGRASYLAVQKEIQQTKTLFIFCVFVLR